ncbi:MAG: MFS transporter [Phenylobacterium sp.]|uniref:MFS transporter n=1 Tax=Phenylobacterium sp. TaxID=1871053 RepID=UPI0012060BEE|nr:MFS transporter [Phenylobacterium sp.]TAJ68955.1 MAG: MFS transporter [Phenylobacterium sp.]
MTTTAAVAPVRAAFGPLVVPLLALAVFINYVDRGNLATAAPLIKGELALSSTQVGFLISAFFWTYTPGQILAGWLTERINAYRTLAVGLALWSLATLLSGFATGFVGLFVLRLLLGVGESAAFPCSSKLIAQHVPAHKLGGANGLIIMGLSLGPAVGIFFGGLLMAELGWRGVFILFGALSVLWLWPWLAATRKLSAAAATLEEGRCPSFLTILVRPELWGASLGHFSVNFGFYFVISWMPLYLVQEQGYSLAEMAGIGGLVYLAYAAASLASGWISDRWIGAGGTPNLVRKTFFVGSHLLAATALMACAFGTPDAALASLFVTGVAFGTVGPHIFATGQTLAGPRAAGKWMGVQNCFSNMAGILGPIATGVIIDRTGGFHAAFIMTAALSLLGVVGWGLMIRKIAPVDWTAKAGA